MFIGEATPAKAAKRISETLAAAHSRTLEREVGMRYPSAVVVAAVSYLAAGLANVSAKADVFDFSFGSGVSGAFTTGAAASDPGYQLITGLTFDLLSGKYNDGFDFSFTNVVGKDFASAAAFNPTTDAFINHAAGGPYNNVGNFVVAPAPGATGSIDGVSFARGAYFISGVVIGDSGNANFRIDAPLVITPEGGPSVPEASTWALMLFGFGGLGLAARRRRLGAAFVAPRTPTPHGR
jgi:PEP-CTERM motif-containing protein